MARLAAPGGDVVLVSEVTSSEMLAELPGLPTEELVGLLANWRETATITAGSILGSYFRPCGGLNAPAAHCGCHRAHAVAMAVTRQDVPGRRDRISTRGEVIGVVGGRGRLAGERLDHRAVLGASGGRLPSSLQQVQKYGSDGSGRILIAVFIIQEHEWSERKIRKARRQEKSGVTNGPVRGDVRREQRVSAGSGSMTWVSAVLSSCDPAFLRAGVFGCAASM